MKFGRGSRFSITVLVAHFAWYHCLGKAVVEEDDGNCLSLTGSSSGKCETSALEDRDKRGDGEGNSQNVQKQEQECGMWLAESAIEGAGLGMYTGKFIPAGERAGEPDMVIPLIDLDKRHWSPLHDFTWNGDVLNDLFFENSFLTDAVIPGLGAHINCHMGLNNLDLTGKALNDNAGLHRTQNDPAVGSFTPRYNYTKRAIKDILPGEELFISYGENWFVDREDSLGFIPFTEHYNLADHIGQTILPHIKQNDSTNTASATVFPTELWEFIYNLAEPRLQQALPTNASAFQVIADQFGGSTARASCPNSVRPISWLQQHGFCVDQLYAALSTIPGAGRGAFTKRSFQKGDIITVSPVVHFSSKEIPIKQQYRTVNDEHGFISTKIRGQQLLLNYAFGQQNSTILFTPYGPVTNFINHNSTPNAYIRWLSTPHKYHKQKLLHLAADALVRENHGLMIEYVALRNIAPNEEVFLDYGESWVKAWEYHKEHYQKSDVPYVSASEYRNLHPDEPVRTVKEQQTNPYPSNLLTACFYCSHGESPISASILSSLDEADTGIVEYRLNWDRYNDNGCLRPCSILSRNRDEGGNYYYSALMSPFIHEFIPLHYQIPPDERHIVYRVPASKVMIVDREYTTDIHSPKAFRHFINAPAKMFPESWSIEQPKRVVYSPDYLEPFHIEHMKWQEDAGKKNAQPIADYALTVGIPKKFTETLLEYCNRMGITKRFQELLYVKPHNPDMGTYEDFRGLQWFVQRPATFWNSNMHWISPADAASHDDYLRVLGDAGLNPLLEVIGERFKWEGLVCFHVTFIGVSECDEGYSHYDFHDTGGKGFNIIIPLILVNDSKPELDVFSGDSAYQDTETGHYKYKYNVASLLGDNAIHSTSAINYTKTKKFRMAATVYVADVQPWNIDSILLDYTQAYPPKDPVLLLKDAGKHWRKGESAKLPSGSKVFRDELDL